MHQPPSSLNSSQIQTLFSLTLLVSERLLDPHKTTRRGAAGLGFIFSAARSDSVLRWRVNYSLCVCVRVCVRVQIAHGWCLEAVILRMGSLGYA